MCNDCQSDAYLVFKFFFYYQVTLLTCNFVYEGVFCSISSDIEDISDPANVSYSSELSDTKSLLERLQHAEQRAKLAEIGLATAQEDLQKMK